MNSVPATDAKNHFGELLEAATKEPIEISKKGRPVAVVLSVQTFREMQANIQENSAPPGIDGILKWIDQHPAKGQAMDEQDYNQYLDDKFA